MYSFFPATVHSGAAGCEKRFVKCFLKVSLAWAAWQLQYSPTAWGTLRKQFTKPSEQVAGPPGSASSTEFLNDQDRDQIFGLDCRQQAIRIDFWLN